MPSSMRLESVHQTADRRRVRRAEPRCRRPSSRFPAPPTRLSLRPRTAHRIHEHVDGLLQLQPPVDAVDGVRCATALADHRFAITNDELDLRSSGEPEQVAHLGWYGDLPLRGDATSHAVKRMALYQAGQAKSA